VHRDPHAPLSELDPMVGRSTGAPVVGASGGGPGPDTSSRRTLRVGIGGPVGTGKTSLIREVCRSLADERQIAVVTNDIFTTEDAKALRRAGVLPPERIRAVETGGCPHTAIRDDIAANLDAVEAFERDLPDLDLVLVESGGDNLTAIFSQALVDRQLFVIDTAAGDDIPRKGGPGITSADLLVVNKTDLAPHVGADLDRMARDAAARRGDRPTLFTSLVGGAVADLVVEWLREQVAVRRGPVSA